VGECFFWYRLTWVVPDKIYRAVKQLCVCVCDYLCEEQGYNCTVAVQLKLIVTNLDIMSKTLCYILMDWSHLRGRRRQLFCQINGQGRLHLLARD